MQRFVVIDGQKYALAQGSYFRRWVRAFSSQLAGGIIRLNFVDRGPGLRTYTFTIILNNWASDSAVFKDGVTASLDTQRYNLEFSYSKIATPINFTDPFGDFPFFDGTLSGSISSGATSLSVDAVTAKFTDTQTKPFFLYIWDAGKAFTDPTNHLEIVQVTAGTGGTYTVTRGQQGTSAQAHSNGDTVALKIGVYFTNLNMSIPNYSTNEKGYATADVELTEALQVVA